MSHGKAPRLSGSSGKRHARISSEQDQEIASFQAREKAYKKQIRALTRQVQELLQFKQDTQAQVYCLDIKGKQLELIDVGRKIQTHLQQALYPFVSIMEVGKEHKYFNEQDMETITDSLHTFYKQFNHRLAIHEVDRTTEPLLKCPILDFVFTDPVITADGHTYERANIQKYFDRNLHHGEARYKSPKTNLPLQSYNLTPNHVLKQLLHEMFEVQSNILKAQHASTIHSQKAWMQNNIQNIIDAYKRSVTPHDLTLSSDDDASDQEPDNDSMDPDYNP